MQTTYMDEVINEEIPMTVTPLLSMRVFVPQGLGMCKVCTEAVHGVHAVALWTRTLSQVWECVKYAPKQPMP